MQVAYVLYWWLALIAIGFVSFPLTSRICGGLEDRGYSISKIVGLMLFTFISWLLASIKMIPFGYASIFVSLFILAALSIFFGRKNLRIAEWPWKKILISDLIFSAAFILLVLVQFGKSDIYYKGAADAVYNYAFVESIMRGGYLPPVDPYFAGTSIPYYYGGHYLIALLTRFTGVPPSIAFNIALAMFYSIAICACYGLGYNITKRKLYGFIAVLFVCIAGYTAGFFQLMAYASNHTVLGYAPIGANNVIDWMQNFDFLSAQGIIEAAIVLYPSNTFLMGDMHTYFMSIPFQLAYITLIYAVFQKSRGDSALSRPDTLLSIAILSVCLGFFFILNTWEFPTYVIFTFAAFIFLKIRPRIIENLFIPLIIAALGFTLYLPYYLSGKMSGFSGINLVPSVLRTSLAQFLEFGALFLFILITFVLILWKREFFAGKRAIIAAAALLIPIVLIAVFLHFQILVIVVPIGLLCLYFLYKSKVKAEREFVLLLIMMAMALVFFCDFMYIDDVFGGNNERFNTVMKVYCQVWIFFGVAAAYGLYAVSRSVNGKRKLVRIGKFVWVGVVALLIIACLIHPVATTASMLSGRHDYWGDGRGTLDGAAYIEEIDKGDYEAIKWINENIGGSPVILEMPGDACSYSSRVSAFTGLPTVIGWRMYEVAWRSDWGGVNSRTDDVGFIYNTLDNDKALELLKKEPYNVEYIYVGSLERAKYVAAGLNKFDTFTDDYLLVYQNLGVSIYQVKGD